MKIKVERIVEVPEGKYCASGGMCCPWCHQTAMKNTDKLVAAHCTQFDTLLEITDYEFFRELIAKCQRCLNAEVIE